MPKRILDAVDYVERTINAMARLGTSEADLAEARRLRMRIHAVVVGAGLSWGDFHNDSED